MSRNCPQIKEKFQELLELKEEFVQVSDLADRERLMKGLKTEIQKLEIFTGILVEVDYSRSLEEMIEMGHYDWKSDDITGERLLIDKSEKNKEFIKFKLIGFNKTMNADQVLAELSRQGLRPATLPELLAYGAKFPDKQRKFTIEALGTTWTNIGFRFVPCLGGNDFERRLAHDHYSGGWTEWEPHCRFLAVSEGE